MDTFRVQDGVITIGSTVGKLLNADLEKSQATMESTGGGDEWRERKPGYKDWRLSGTFRFQDNFQALGEEATVTLEVDDSDGAAQFTATGEGIVTRARISGDHENVWDMDIEVEGNGALTES